MDRQDKRVVSSSCFSIRPASTLTDTLADVDQANFSAAWRKNQELRRPQSEVPLACSGIPWVQEVLTQVRKLWGSEVAFIPCSPAEEATISSVDHVSILQERPLVVPLVAVLVDQHQLVFLGQQPPESIAQLITFSPAAFQSRQTKAHFLMFQLLQLFHRIENLGLSPGPVSLHQLHLSQSLLLQAKHSMTATTLPLPPHLPVIDTNATKLRHQLNNVMWKVAGEEGIEISLDKAVQLWSKRELSNLDYLLFLNYLAGRRFGQPNHHVSFFCIFTKTTNFSLSSLLFRGSQTSPVLSQLETSPNLSFVSPKVTKPSTVLMKLGHTMLPKSSPKSPITPTSPAKPHEGHFSGQFDHLGFQRNTLAP